MADRKYTIVFESGQSLRKICKVWFGSDGSYYVTVPYHPAKKAVLIKHTVNYVTSVPTTPDDRNWAPLSEAIDVASSDDARLKLSHHPDGFIQFSGQGLVSGRNPDGSFKGIGISSWALRDGCRGPAFSLCIFGMDEFDVADSKTDYTCVVRDNELTFLPANRTLIIEGHYFPILWRRFIQKLPDGTPVIPIVHPAGAVLHLKVLLPDDECPIGGFFGLELFGGVRRDQLLTSGYSLSSSTGNARKNDKGELLGDGLVCFYPRPEDLPVVRSLDYPPVAQTTSQQR